MRDFRDSKTMAQSLRRALADQQVTITHSESLELIAKAFGLDNWNILAARIEAERPLSARPEPTDAAGGKTFACSFCGKTQYVVERLIAGPNVFICNECVTLCDGICLEGDIERRFEAARAGRPDGDPLDIARDAFSLFSDERLERCRQSFADHLEHMAWGIRETTRALARKPDETWRPDAYAEARGWKLDPLSGKSRDQIAAQKTQLEQRSAEARRRAELITRILKERGVVAPTPVP